MARQGRKNMKKEKADATHDCFFSSPRGLPCRLKKNTVITGTIVPFIIRKRKINSGKESACFLIHELYFLHSISSPRPDNYGKNRLPV